MPSATDYGLESVQDFVNEVLGVEGQQVGRELIILCPDPKHMDSTPSCGVNLESGYWHCFSCGAGGDIAKLGSLVLERSRDEIELLLKPNTPQAMHEALVRKLAHRMSKPRREKRIEVVQDYPDHINHDRNPELRLRGFSSDLLEAWGLRWIPSLQMQGNKGMFTITDSFAIPIRDASGACLAWCFRSSSTSSAWQPRYLYTPGVEISELWYGLEHHSKEPYITVVEGALDVLWLRQSGFPALGLLGSKMGDRKINLLKTYRRAYILPDRDMAGMRWAMRVGKQIGSSMDLRVCQYRTWMQCRRWSPDGPHRASDPEELWPADIEILHATATPYLKWKQSILATSNITPARS